MENKILNDQLKNSLNNSNDTPKETLKDPVVLDENINQKNNIEKNINDLEDIIPDEDNIKIVDKIKEDSSSAVITVDTDKTQKEIEDIILKDGMEEFYEALSEKNKESFNKNLKITSKKIKDLLDNTKNKLSKIINKVFVLIKKLLKTLGLKDYGYLEKSIKNKVSDIIKLKKQ